MHITSIKTHKILPEKDTDILAIIDQYIDGHAETSGSHPQPKDAFQARTGKAMLGEGSVLAVTSKIVSICEGRFVPMEGQDKDALIAQEAEQYLPIVFPQYKVTVTINNGIFGAGAGIDESNGNGYYILWPQDIQQSANRIREHLARRFGLNDIGVIITDSKTTPLRWGVTGIALAHSGFLALKDYIGTPDIFGRDFHYEKLNIADCLATAGVLAMGEGKEQTPLAIISDIPTISYQNRNPTTEELESLKISIDDDLYGEFLKNASWIKGKKS